MFFQFSPEFVIALIRTPHLPPRFAQFYVPLEFNKMDMRDYMKRAYGIKVLAVRSFVEQQKVTRERKFGKPGYGPLRRPKSKKKMTIEMTQPFTWPEPPKSDEEYVFFSCPKSIVFNWFWERPFY
jgi:large subunit ribosomal protein L23